MSISMKIKSQDEIADLISHEKNNNKVVVHAHGCFDLLHYGHIRFLQKGKQLGDILVVSVTSASFINKGPGRPIFSDDQRLFQLSSLECVDYVCINFEPDACNILVKLQPSITIRGSEYKDSSSDITGKIDIERKSIESVYGEMVFLDEPVFSSTELINIDNDHLVSEVALYKERFSSNNNLLIRINNFFKNLKLTSVLLIGDLIIDEYIYANVLGTVSKHSVISASYKRNEVMGGGSLAIAKHIANFVKDVNYISRVGEKSDKFNSLIFDEINSNINPNLIEESNSFSVTKSRYIASGYPNPLSKDFKNNTTNTNNRLFEISHLPNLINSELEVKLIKLLQDGIQRADLLIVSDFGHGLLSKKIIKYVCESKCFIALNVQTNSSNFGFNLITKYSRADFICIDEVEARLALSDRYSDIDEIAEQILSLINCHKLMITRGKQGLIYYSHGEKFIAPALSNEIVDAVGAGDAVFSATSLCAYHNLDANSTTLIGSIMGMIATKIVGNQRSIESHEVIGNINGLLKNGSL
jgi:rfaE bifunctional protein nucleotidyltransferase chain/domain